MNIFKRKKNSQKTQDNLSLREADEIIKDFVVESKDIAKRTKELRKAFMLNNHIPKSFLENAEVELRKKGVPYYACKVLALSECIDESLNHRD
tara:strand:+ start:2522 stop:2800 length:279 start_codon:yes stop_codon:yes gene_type:complete